MMRKAAILLFCVLLPLAAQSSLSGRRAPSFSLPDSHFQQHDLLDYRGRWLLLDFMKTDCPHCQALSKLLESRKSQLGNRAAVLAIVIAPPENQATVARYVAETKTTAPIVFDQGQVAISYFKATPQNPSFDTPHLFAIDPNGMIVRDWNQNQVEARGFAAELEQLIAGKK
jgi:peroxiredoxin